MPDQYSSLRRAIPSHWGSTTTLSEPTIDQKNGITVRAAPGRIPGSFENSKQIDIINDGLRRWAIDLAVLLDG